MTATYDAYLLFLLVLTRMTGALLLNPILGRRNVPAMVKISLALMLAIVVTPTLTAPAPSFPTPLSFMLALIREMLIGYALGLVMNLFISWVLVAGEAMDMEMGTSVSKIYDPASGASLPLTGTALNVMLTLIFFASNSHLTLIRIMAQSLQMFPPGPRMIAADVGQTIAMMLGNILILSLKLAMPVLAIELLSEAGMGALMRIVPQINVFVVGLQIKLGIGLLIVVLALPAISRLMDLALTEMFQQLQKSLAVMLG